MFDYKEYLKQYREKNKERLKIFYRQWQVNNPERTKEATRRYREKYPERIIECNRQYVIKNRLEVLRRNEIWRKNNPDYMKNYKKHRRKIDIKFNLDHRMNTAIGYSLKNNKANRHWEDIVGYTLKDLIKRLTKTMPEGYNWKDFLEGKLHIDHILPKRLFGLEEFKQCWSLDNLRLLIKKENLLKRDSINNPILLGLLLKELI